MESKRWSGNCACASHVGDAGERAWNVALAELRPHRALAGERYFAGSFLENELAPYLKGYWTVTNWKALKTLES